MIISAVALMAGIVEGKVGVGIMEILLSSILSFLLARLIHPQSRVFSVLAPFLLLVGFLSTQHVLRVLKDVSVTTWEKQRVQVSSEPRNHNGKQEVLVVSDKLKGPLSAVLLEVPSYPEYHYGDLLEVTGKVGPAPEFEDFSYREYLAQQGVGLYSREVSLVKVGEGGSWFQHGLVDFRLRLVALADGAFTQPLSSLVLGTLVGVQRDLPPALLDSLRVTGLLHVVVVSGFNMMLLMRFVEKVQVGLRRELALLLSSILMLGYALLVGFSVPVLRALLLAWIVLFGRWLGRQRGSLEMLCLVAILMLIKSPLSLYSVSFQLSFLAALALVVVVPILEEAFRSRSKTVNELLISPLVASVGVTLLVLPVLIRSFGLFSITFLPANLVASFLIPYVMVTGALSLTVQGLLGGLSPIFVSIMSSPSILLLFTAQLLSGCRGFTITGLKPGLPTILFYYLFLSWVLWLGRARVKV